MLVSRTFAGGQRPANIRPPASRAFPLSASKLPSVPVSFCQAAAKFGDGGILSVSFLARSPARCGMSTLRPRSVRWPPADSDRRQATGNAAFNSRSAGASAASTSLAARTCRCAANESSVLADLARQLSHFEVRLPHRPARSQVRLLAQQGTELAVESLAALTSRSRTSLNWACLSRNLQLMPCESS